MDGWGGLRQVTWAALGNWLVITLQNVDVMQPCPSSLSTGSFLILQFRNYVTPCAGRGRGSPEVAAVTEDGMERSWPFHNCRGKTAVQINMAGPLIRAQACIIMKV